MNHAIALEGFLSDGSCKFPPNASMGPYLSTCYFGSRRVQIRGVTQYPAHCIGNKCHPIRIVVNPSKPTFFLENLPVAFEGDLITCGDHIRTGQSTCGAYA
jgi:hypothetical protein